MKLIISNVSGVPIYEQIKQQIKAAILSGELQAEETLPWYIVIDPSSWSFTTYISFLSTFNNRS